MKELDFDTQSAHNALVMRREVGKGKPNCGMRIARHRRMIVDFKI